MLAVCYINENDHQIQHKRVPVLFYQWTYLRYIDGLGSEQKATYEGVTKEKAGTCSKAAQARSEIDLRTPYHHQDPCGQRKGAPTGGTISQTILSLLAGQGSW